MLAKWACRHAYLLVDEAERHERDVVAHIAVLHRHRRQIILFAASAINDNDNDGAVREDEA